MILSDQDIQKHIDAGDISIEPFTKDHLNPASYVLTLNNTLWIPKQADLIDTKTSPEYDQIDLSDEGYTINPGDFLLVQTKEKISLSTNIAAFLDARTSLARLGLNVLQSSTLIEPGTKESHQTLEVSNISNSPIKIHPNMKIVKCIFQTLSSPATKGYQGNYQEQTDASPKL